MTGRGTSPRAGLYVHVPYCKRRCPYCDFYFEVKRPDASFVDAVLCELDARIGEIGEISEISEIGEIGELGETGASPEPCTRPRACSLSLGGGTPTALPARELVRLLEGVRARVALDADAEVSLEANPENITPDLAHALVDAGYTRASLGVQGFDDALLRFLGRAHDRQRAIASIDALVGAGLDVGVDLIVGVPGETAARIDDDVHTCAAHGVVHVSTYLLTIESGTALERLVRIGKRAAVDDDAQADAYERAQRALSAHGYEQYEVSSHAKPGHESEHNRLYWSHAPYLGLGPGAHSMRLLEGGRVLRRHNSARLEAWLVDPTRAQHEDEELEPGHALREGVAFGLRDLKAGVDLSRLRALHKVGEGNAEDLAVRAALDAAVARGDARAEGAIYRLTPSGARFADRVARDVLASDVLAANAARR